MDGKKSFLSVLLFFFSFSVWASNDFDIAAVDRGVDGYFPPESIKELIRFGQRIETTSVSVVLDVDWMPEGYLSDAEVLAQRSRIMAAQ